MAKQYDARPAMALDAGKKYSATIELAKGGIFVADLFPDVAPETVNSFVFLAQDGYYDGITFHRVILDFMAQGGDPTGTGTGGPGYNVPDEVNDNKHTEGTLSMAKTAAPDSAGSQFFVCLADVSHLDGQYSVFGRVREGLEVIHTIRERDPGSDSEAGDAIKTITISVE
jgi:cyclophilin family peptidyl-prolyl cis-trans isomerase